jgi:hypothetical protein
MANALVGASAEGFQMSWGSNLRLTLVEKYQKSNVDLTPNLG